MTLTVTLNLNQIPNPTLTYERFVVSPGLGVDFLRYHLSFPHSGVIAEPIAFNVGMHSFSMTKMINSRNDPPSV